MGPTRILSYMKCFSYVSYKTLINHENNNNRNDNINNKPGDNNRCLVLPVQLL